MRLACLTALLLAVGVPSLAQEAEVLSVPADKVAAVFASGGRFGGASDYSASVLRRTSAGQSEIHVTETDIFYIVDGEATFVTGGTMISVLGRRVR
jgi:hypothetical protein